MLAARREDRQDHQVGIGVEPLLGLLARGFRRSRDIAEMLAARERPQVIQANPRKPRNFLFGEEASDSNGQ